MNCHRLLALIVVFISLVGCAKPEKFPAIDLKVAGPADVAVSKDGKYFYVLNTDFDHTYATGSILVIDEDGEKVASIKTPRLGRSIAVAGTDMIVTFDKSEDEGNYEVHLYDLTKDPANPELVSRWTNDDESLRLDCTPMNAVLREGYKHFAVTCVGGRIFIGTLNTPRTNSELVPVREYQDGGRSRRAMYIDPQRELLLAFPTDMDKQEMTDLLTTDEKSFDAKTGAETAVPNEVPDEYEDTKFRRKNFGPQRYRYQYLVYNIASEREAGFPLRKLDDPLDKVVPNEQRAIYFTLSDFDGTPDTDAQVVDTTKKHYRTNFWSAQPDPFDTNAFYLSHRGKRSKNSRFANNVIRVSLIGDLTKTSPVLPTSQVLSFERVYGFTGELDEKNHFPGEFKIQTVEGLPVLVVNHFKDLVNFRKEASFSIAAKLLDGSLWRGEVQSTSQSASYYQVAINARGRILSCSFYSNAVIPLELSPGTAINLGWDKITKIE